MLLTSGAMLTDPGRQRSVNEDWCGSRTPDDTEGGASDTSIWVIADGVSQFGTGREAAKIAVETTLSALDGVTGRDAEARLREAVDRSNRELIRRARETSQSRPVQYPTTLLIVITIDADAWIANIGDCRAYHLRGGSIRQLTRDHTWVAEEIALGRLRPEEAARHPKRNMLTRCLGQPAVQPDIFRQTLEPDDRLVLCTDGLVRHVSDAEIVRIVAAESAESACARLVRLANQRGGSDNITVAVLEVATVTAREELEPTDGGTIVFSDLGTSRLAVLQSISQRINASLDIRETLSSVMDSLVEITGAERGFVMLYDERAKRLEFQIGRNLDARAVARDQKISRSIVDRVFREGRPLLIGDAMSDPDFNASQSVIMQSIRSVMCVPLLSKGRSIGVVYVDNSLGAGLFRQQDLDLLSAFAHMAASALENARLHDRLTESLREISAMKTSQDRILRSVSSGIVSVERDGTITSFNRAAAEMLAVPIDRAIGRSLRSILPASFMLALGPPLAGEGIEPGATIAGFEMRGDLPGRGWVHFRHQLSPLRDESGATVGYVVVLDDMTERERLERERRQAAAEREKIESIFKHYVAPGVFDEIMRRGAAGAGIGGDYREMTVMFADIRNFTNFSEASSPREVVDMLNSYLGAATKVIFEHKGTIDKFIGDAIMALFGAPLEIVDHPFQAVKAALEMQRRFSETPTHGGRRISWGIGINTGQGIVGTIGAPELMSFTAIGDVVNVAARLQGKARGGEVLISSDTYDRIADRVEVEELGPEDLKGKRGLVTVYKVMRLRR